jgi:hypothetical protein
MIFGIHTYKYRFERKCGEWLKVSLIPKDFMHWHIHIFRLIYGASESKPEA